MPALTFFHLIAVFQFSDTKNYIIFEGYTPNFIKFGRLVAKQLIGEKTQKPVSRGFSAGFTNSELLGNLQPSNFERSQLSTLATKFDEIWSVTHKYNVVFDIRKLENCNQMEKS